MRANSWVCFLLQAHLSSCSDKEKGAQERLVEPLMSLVKSYEGGRESHARIIVQSLFEEYLSVEELFSDNIQVSSIILIADTILHGAVYSIMNLTKA